MPLYFSQVRSVLPKKDVSCAKCAAVLDVNQLLLFITALQQTGEGAKFGFKFSSLKCIVWLVTVY